MAEDIKRMLKPLAYETVLTKLEIIEVADEGHIELVDKAGNSFKYGEERDFEPDVYACSWFGVTPDVHNHL